MTMFDIADTDISVISSVVGAYVSSDKLVPLSINIHTHCDIVYPEWETWVGRRGPSYQFIFTKHDTNANSTYSTKPNL